MSIESRSHQYGSVFGQWQIQKPLGTGSGGKSAVFLLKRKGSDWDELCALKVICLIEEEGSFQDLSSYRQKEYQEALSARKQAAITEVRLMAQLRGNTNIVDYLDYQFEEWADDSGFGCDLLIRMEYLAGLRSDLRKGRRFDSQEIVQIGKDLATALILCHSKNILHRDIKPENIFYNANGNFKLGDFGISRIIDASPDANATTGIGTPEYAAPEQDKGQYNLLVDIYSLGIVLYELANQNRLPFAASSYVSPVDITKRMMGTPLLAPSNASPELATVILKACAFNPEERYQTAHELLDALSGLVLDKAPSVQNAETNKRSSVVDSGTPYETVAAINSVASDYVTMPAEASETPTSNAYDTIPAEDTSTSEHKLSKEDIEKFHACQEAAEQGDPEAQFNLGQHYSSGFGELLPQNLEEAFRWYKKSADQGFSQAQCSLAFCYLRGTGVVKDMQTAQKWFLKASRQGDSVAQYMLGSYFFKGKNAIDWLEKSALQFYTPAMSKLAKEYVLQTPSLHDRAFYWAERVAAEGDYSAFLILAELYYDGGEIYPERKIPKDYARARDLFERVANQSEDTECKGNALWYIGEYYYRGVNCNKDYATAIKFYTESTQYEHSSAFCSLGKCYYFGWGVPIDYEKAFELFQRAGNTDMLVECYYYGRGVNQDYDKAVKLCLSEDYPSKNVSFILGMCYYNGTGITQDTKKGIELMQDIWMLLDHQKRNGNDVSSSRYYHEYDIKTCVHYLYLCGLFYSDKNPKHTNHEQARFLFSHAAELGHPGAMLKLAIGYKLGFGLDSEYPLLALEWAQKSLAAGNKDASLYYDMWLGDLKTRDGKKDNEILADHYFALGQFETAADYYHRAIQLGSKNSKANLDQCLAQIPLLHRIKWKAQHRS